MPTGVNSNFYSTNYAAGILFLLRSSAAALSAASVFLLYANLDIKKNNTGTTKMPSNVAASIPPSTVQLL